MIFLQPLLLFLGALISIPFIIHLLGEQKYRPLEFSSLKFLREIERDSLRTLQLRQWLILISRALWISMLVLALAHPYFSSARGSLAPGILLIDKSFSTQQDPEFSIAEDAFRKEYSRWFIMEYNENSHPDTLKRIMAEHIESNKIRMPNIILFSDFQDNSLNRSLQSAIGELSARTIYVPLTKDKANKAISALHFLDELQQQGKTAGIGVRVSQNDREEATVYVRINGQQAGRASLDEGNYGTFYFDPGQEEYVQCMARTSEDAYPGDNERYLVFRTYNKIKLLCISDNLLSGYHLNALRSMERINLKVSSPEMLAAEDLGSYDMIWMSGLYSLPTKQENALLNFAETRPLLISTGTEMPEINTWENVTGTLSAEGPESGFYTVSVNSLIPSKEMDPSNSLHVLRYYTGDKNYEETIWVLNQGSPLLVRERTNLYILMSPLHFEWNEMGLSPYFTPLLNEFIASAVRQEKRVFTTGEPIPMPRPQSRIITPAGEVHYVKDVFKDTNNPGFYSIEASDTRYTVAVNHPGSEMIQTTFANDSSLLVKADRKNLTAVHTEVKGRNAATLFYLLSGIFIMLEMLLLRKGEKTK